MEREIRHTIEGHGLVWEDKSGGWIPGESAVSPRMDWTWKVTTTKYFALFLFSFLPKTDEEKQLLFQI